jgi:hypothetical protein
MQVILITRSGRIFVRPKREVAGPCCVCDPHGGDYETRNQEIWLCLLPAPFWFIAKHTLPPWRWRFLGNVDWISPDYTALYLRRQNYSLLRRFLGVYITCPLSFSLCPWQCAMFIAPYRRNRNKSVQIRSQTVKPWDANKTNLLQVSRTLIYANQ